MHTDDSPNLDLLRALAVLAVVIDHLVPTMAYHGITVPAAVLAWTAHLGQSGVLAFFVHTSLVLMYSLQRMAARHGERGLARRFCLRRAFRIYPLATCCIVLALALGLPAMTWRETPPITGQVVVANLLLVQNFWTKQSVIGPLWSLPYEVQMYLVLPALFFLARMKSGAAIIAALFVLACAGGVLVDAVTHGRMNIAAYVPCFLAGVLCHALRERIAARMPAWCWPLFVVGMVAAYCLLHLDRAQPVYWIGWIHCLLLGLAINAFRDSSFAPLNAVVRQAATCSYGIYLLHVPVLYLVFDVLGLRNAWLAILLYLVVTWALSLLAWRWLESPLVSLGRRLSDAPAAKPQPVQDGV
ncbi:MAG: acyltransferase [Pseudoxanthomonas sp.]